MARIGIKGLTYAPYTSGGNDAAVVYGTGTKQDDLMIRANVNIEREDVSQHADNHRIEHANGVTGATVELELARLPAKVKTDLLGYETEGSGNTQALALTGDETPYVGVGYIENTVTDGVPGFLARWFYKVQFAMNSFEAQTKGEQTEFGSHGITGTAMGVTLAAGAKIRYEIEQEFATEQAARTWLNGQANIT